VFAGAFTLDSATAVIAGSGILGPEAVESLANLVAKSLVLADVSGAVAQYRLLDTTRAYALQKLAESGELEALERRHAEHHRNLLEHAEAEWEGRPTAEWLADYGCKIDDVRNALNWAFQQPATSPLPLCSPSPQSRCGSASRCSTNVADALSARSQATRPSGGIAIATR